MNNNKGNTSNMKLKTLLKCQSNYKGEKIMPKCSINSKMKPLVKISISGVLKMDNDKEKVKENSKQKKNCSQITKDKEDIVNFMDMCFVATEDHNLKVPKLKRIHHKKELPERLFSATLIRNSIDSGSLTKTNNSASGKLSIMSSISNKEKLINENTRLKNKLSEECEKHSELCKTHKVIEEIINECSLHTKNYKDTLQKLQAALANLIIE